MSKKIKIIDLINTLANNDKKPYQVKYEGNIYTCDCLNHYVNKKNGTSLFYAVIDYKDFLNDTVEIIEEQEEIDIRKLDFLVEYESFEDYDCRDIGIAITKINKITKTINKIVDLIQQRNDKFKNIEIRLEQLDKNIKEKQ